MRYSLAAIAANGEALGPMIQTRLMVALLQNRMWTVTYLLQSAMDHSYTGDLNSTISKLGLALKP